MDDNENNFIAQNIDMFCCPKCGGDLSFSSESFDCLNCHQPFQVLDGVPSLFWPNEWDTSKEDVTDKIKSFYEETPFPDYDEFDNLGSLINKAKKGIFAKLLDDQIPFGTRILDCGCGTGQLTNFLSIASRTVIGTDICMNSLIMAEKFKEANDEQLLIFNGLGTRPEQLFLTETFQRNTGYFLDVAANSSFTTFVSGYQNINKKAQKKEKKEKDAITHLLILSNLIFKQIK